MKVTSRPSGFAAVKVLLSAFAAVVIFIAGAEFGSRRATVAAAQAYHFGQPKTILQVSLLKWREGVPDAEAQRVLDGVRALAAQIPGIKNIWMKTSRMQPRDFDAAFVIEFVDRDAADRYAESPIHDAWSKKLQAIRETSLSPQVTN
jgi:hypothetical protein